MVSSYKISHYLEGVDYPARKQDLIKQAKKNKAPKEVLSALDHLPNVHFGNIDALWEGIKNID